MHRMMSYCVLLLLLLAGCTSVAAIEPATTTTFVIVRHAEKADDGTRDPSLSAAGLARAQALAQRLARSGLVAVYATPFRRTQQTAQVVATMAGLPVTTYAADVAPSEFAATLRARMAWIGQRPHIFAGTMNSNVTLGRPEVSPYDVQQAIDLASLRRIAIQRGGAPIGEGGAGLSGGEALRLAIARAAATPHADIILADEPTAHLDAETARDVTDALLAVAHGRTLVVATHDPALAARMERIIHIDASAREEAA